MGRVKVEGNFDIFVNLGKLFCGISVIGFLSYLD